MTNKFSEMKKLKTLFYIGLLLISTIGFSQSEHLFEKGKDHYKNQEYQKAINAWKGILQNEEVSAELYYNLGNAYYRLNQIGPSIYYYEKALQLAPNDADIKNNLAFAENARIDAIEPLPKSVFTSWYENLTSIFTFDGWAILSVSCAIGFAALFLLYYFSYTEKKKRLFFASSMVVALLLIGATTMAFLTYNDYTEDQPAIIFANELEVKSEPSLGSSSVFKLHEGTKVQIIAQDREWVRIELADGKDGWVPISDLKQL